MTECPDVPIPPGATADDWCRLTGQPAALIRFLTWSHHDAAGIGVTVDGAQYPDGRVERYVSVYGDNVTLTAAQARQLAAALLAARRTYGLRRNGPPSCLGGGPMSVRPAGLWALYRHW